MLQKVFQVELQSPPDDVRLQHPLHVGLAKKDFQVISRCAKKFNNISDPNMFIAVLMKNYSSVYTFPECIFVIAYAADVGSKRDVGHSAGSKRGDYPVPVFVTKKFLSHYNMQLGSFHFMKSVSCFSLEKVVIGAKTSQALALFRDPQLYKQLILQSCQRTFLCIEEDAMLAVPRGIPFMSDPVFFDYAILDCQPFCQGVLNLKSTVVVVDISDRCEKNINLYSDDTPGHMTITSNALSFHHLNYYTPNILGIRSMPVVLNSKTKPLFLPIKLNTIFEIRVVHRFSDDFQKELQRAKVDIDLDTIFVTAKALKMLNANEGSWVRVKLIPTRRRDSDQSFPSLTPSPNAVSDDEFEKLQKAHFDFFTLSKSQRNDRYARICSFADEKIASHYFHCDEMVYMSPHLWFNLNKHPSRLIQPDVRLSIEVIDELFSPPYAVEAFASLVQSPNYDGTINCDVAMFEYFKTTRYINKGDIFCIYLKDLLDASMKDHEENTLKSLVVYFQITKIEGPPSICGYLFDNLHCRLYQSGTKQNYVPVTMEMFLATTPCHPIWDSAVPNGLKRYVNQIQELAFPFLNLHKSNCRMSSNILFSGPVSCGKTSVVKAVCKSLNLHLYQVDCHKRAGESSAVAEAKLKIKIDKGSTYAPCVIQLKNIHFVGKEKDMNAEDSRVLHSLCSLLKNVNSYGCGRPILVIATTNDPKMLSSNLASAFLHSVHMEPPNEEERLLLLNDLLTVCTVGNDVSALYLAQRTAGFVLGDLCALVNQAVRNAYSRIRKFVGENGLTQEDEEDIILASVPVVQRDLLNALEKLQSEYAEAIGAPKIPNVAFDDVGGLANVKQEILDTIQLPLEHPEILLSGLRRSGILLYGPPGTGKTLLAKAVATECSLNFLSVKGPELINMYVGQSEENVRAVFSQARSAVPCVIFFDELDSLAPNRGRSGDSGGVMDRVVSQLLAELDGLNKKSEVFVIGATNRPDLLDPALLRPGRFDRLLYVGIPEDTKSKLSILKALTRKFPLSKDVDLEEIASKCPPNLSGADLYSLCSNAVIKRVEMNVKLLEDGIVEMDNLDSDVHKCDFLSALETLIPSVTPQQLRQYKEIELNMQK